MDVRTGEHERGRGLPLVWLEIWTGIWLGVGRPGCRMLANHFLVLLPRGSSLLDAGPTFVS